MKHLNLPEPPAAYAHDHWDEASRRLWFEYNGREVISFEIPGEQEVKFRRASDGLLQSAPVIQQTFVALPEGQTEANVTFRLSPEGTIMRPRRARPDEAVIGQVGYSTIEGINGLYDIQNDLLIDWHGQPWQWLDTEFNRMENGDLTVRIAVRLNQSPLVVNVRPMYYRDHLGYRYHAPWDRRPSTKPVAGWCSWEAYRRDVSEEKVLETARFLAQKLGAYGLEYIQIDDGYQRLPVCFPVTESLKDAWMEPNEDFPNGFEYLCQEIKKLGFTPGLWISADAEEIEKQEDGSDFRLRDENGNRVSGFWMRAIPDCLDSTIEEHIRPLYEAISEKGFGYVKTDQIRHLLSDALQEAVRLGILSNSEAQNRFRNYMEVCRDALGDDVYYLSSWGVLSEVIGIADACRITIDANTSWKAVRMQIAESARWWHSHRVLFLNDPDHLCVRTHPEWAKSMLSLVSLSGQLLMLSDPKDSYDEQRIEIIQKTLPPLETYPCETGPLDVHYPAYAWVKQHGAAFKAGIEMEWDEIQEEEILPIAGHMETLDRDHPLSSLWAFHLKTDADKWTVAYRFATIPLKPCDLPLEQLNLNPNKEYVAFDFWAQKCLGTFTGSIAVAALELGLCQVIALRKVTGELQWIGSSRHVSADAISVKAQRVGDGKVELDLAGIVGTTESYFFYNPAGTALTITETGAVTELVQSDNKCVEVKVTFESDLATISIG